MQYIFILGNTPKLSSLEIRKVLTNYEVLLDGEQALIVKTQKPLNTKELINKLGGSIKIGLWLGEDDLNKMEAWRQWIPGVLNNFEFKTDKIKFGFSLYNLDKQVTENKLKKLKQTYKKLGLQYKKELRQEKIRAELIESKDLALSSVIVNKERCLDILVLVDKNKVCYGYTTAVQDYKDFSDHDYGRPSRDSKSGMLPPKVARMMVNCTGDHTKELLLDPFCGSGTVLQEALLLGYQKVIGADISDKAISDTQNNLEYFNLKNFTLYTLDAKNLDKIFVGVSRDLPLQKKIPTVVAEVYLGPPNFDDNDLPKIKNELTALYSDIFNNIKKILMPGAKLVIAFPAWKVKDTIIRLPIENQLINLGYKKIHGNRFYGRENARVLREIYFLENVKSF